SGTACRGDAGELAQRSTTSRRTHPPPCSTTDSTRINLGSLTGVAFKNPADSRAVVAYNDGFRICSVIFVTRTEQTLRSINMSLTTFAAARPCPCWRFHHFWWNRHMYLTLLPLSP